MIRLLEGREAHRGPVRRLDAVLGGPIWWAVHLGASYWLVPRLCVWGLRWPLHLLTVVVLTLIARALLSALQLLAAARTAPDGNGAERDRFLAWLGIAFAAFFGSVTVAEWIPTLSLHPCW